MTALRHLLLAFLLFVAQLATGVHAVEHTLEGTVPAHACLLCLEAHDLGAGLPSLPPAIPPVALVSETLVAPAPAFSALTTPQPRQGAPPAV